jgi:dethiobiotin synthetase
MLTLQGKFFVTGTSTEVGKTFVSVQLLRFAKKLGKKVVGIKPIASGAENGLNEDALLLMGAASIPVDMREINPFCFDEPIAPHIAAKQQHISLDAKELAERISPVLNNDTDLCLIEGAGGWAVPLNAHQTWKDFVHCIDVPVILVVGMTLGCINHALLTEQAILADGCQLYGWIANAVDKNMLSYQENIETLQQRMQSRFLGEFPYQENSLPHIEEVRTNPSPMLFNSAVQ